MSGLGVPEALTCSPSCVCCFPVASGDSQARDVSADGSVAVGDGFLDYFDVEHWAMRWVGWQLELSDEIANDEVRAVSGDGRVVAGRFGGTARVGSADFGWRDLRTALIDRLDLSAELTGWTLTHVTGLSADGRVIVGYGNNPSGQVEAWRAQVPLRFFFRHVVPGLGAPALCGLLAFSGEALAARGGLGERRRARPGRAQLRAQGRGLLEIRSAA